MLDHLLSIFFRLSLHCLTSTWWQCQWWPTSRRGGSSHGRLFSQRENATPRKSMLPVTLCRLHGPGSLWVPLLILHFWLSSPNLILACQPKKKQTFPHNIQTNLLQYLGFSIRIKSIFFDNAKKYLVWNASPFPLAIFQTSCAHSIWEMVLWISLR